MIFFGVTTYNRVDFLSRMLSSWDRTRRKDIPWLLAVADDGSADGTLEYLESVRFEGVEKVVVSNHRVGVHRQTNQLLALAAESGFEFGFKVDDDIEFLKEGWDGAYQRSAIETGFHHLVFFDKSWHHMHRGAKRYKEERRGPLHGQVHVIDAFGAFWTFTPQVLEKVGYLDEDGFGKCGWGHVDYSWRCCRAGFNEVRTLFDLADSDEYLRLVVEGYRPAMPPQERVASSNTPEEERVKMALMKQNRVFVPNPDPGVAVSVVCGPFRDEVMACIERLPATCCGGKKVRSGMTLLNAPEAVKETGIVITDNVETVREAGRHGLAVIAKATPEIQQEVDHQVDALIYEHADWCVEWLRRIIINPGLRRKVAAGRRKRYEREKCKVTVVVPCYNHASLLPRSVASAKAQTAKVDVIVVDDGSPDNVQEVAAEMGVGVVGQPNGGLASARNMGFRNARTEWVVPLDADDELMPGFVERCLARAEETGADVVYTNVTTDLDGHVEMIFAPDDLTRRNSLVCTCLIRKSLWQDVGGYDESMRLGFEDWEFWMRCLKAGASFAKVEGDALFHYYNEGRSMLSEADERRGEIMSYIRSKHTDVYAIPKASVVIPCWNQAQYLPRAVESVVRQTVKDVEVIIVNDGSPDDAQEVAEKLRSEHSGVVIRVLTQENKGLPAARNAGFRKAKAEWVLPLDADNALLEDDWLERCLASADMGAGVVYTDLQKMSGQVYRSEVNLARLTAENTLDACALIRKSAWEKVGGYSEEMVDGHEDWDFWIGCIENNISFRKVNGLHVHYDDTHDGRMTPGTQEPENYFRLLAHIKKNHPKFFGGQAEAVEGLTVVVSSYNQRRTLELAFETYSKQTLPPLEVVVADDGSSDGTLEWLDSLKEEDYPFPVRYVTREHSWYRLASVNNLAAIHARGCRILFTNGDQLHNPDSFAAHARMGGRVVGAGVFKGVKHPPSEMVDKAMAGDFRQIEEHAARHPSSKDNAAYIAQTDPNVNPIGVWGGNYSVPVVVFKEMGGYDEGYDVGWGGEENDLVARCVGAGCRVEWVMGSVIYHLDHPIRAYARSMMGSRKYAGMS